MIGVGVRDAYVEGRGFPAFVGVHQDASGTARARMLALSKGIGATRGGCIEMSMHDEASLDLFTEQGFGPAFGRVMMSAVELLVGAGYPPEAVLVELYLSGEFAYSLEKIREVGMTRQMDFHSRTSQYGSITRGARYLGLDAALKEKMGAVLEEIRSGAFAKEWSEQQEQANALFEKIREVREQLPFTKWEDRRAQGVPDRQRGGVTRASRADRALRRRVRLLQRKRALARRARPRRRACTSRRSRARPRPRCARAIPRSRPRSRRSPSSKRTGVSDAVGGGVPRAARAARAVALDRRAARLLPRALWDAAYRAFARRRYRWFGRLDACPIPPPALRARILERSRIACSQSARGTRFQTARHWLAAAVAASCAVSPSARISCPRCGPQRGVRTTAIHARARWRPGGVR